jgi:hypothetical protein
MSEKDPTAIELEPSRDRPPDWDVDGQVDYPDPAFESAEDEDEADMETPDAGEPEAPAGADEDDEDDDEEE